ncbi:hypothetical protein P4M26_02115 [Pseudomonas aeruginosa]|nr:hypothetical protein [Pseudomonas aeruginosa]
MHGAFEQRGQLPQAGFVAFAVDAGEGVQVGQAVPVFAQRSLQQRA